MTLRAAALAGIGLCVAALVWYLGSPLFIRTTANEPAPSGAPPLASPSLFFGAAAVVATPSGPRTLATGELGRVDALHNGTGVVLLIRAAEGLTIRFENVAITNAPDVHVYLSRETGGTWNEDTSLYLGPLKATNGSFNYVVPAEADIAGYKSVIVWCRRFSVLVTWADLR